MSISLSKEQKVSLAKEVPDGKLENVVVGAGWDPAPAYESSIDCDAYIVIPISNGKKKGLFGRSRQQDRYCDMVYFNKPVWKGGLIKHNGDSLTGEGEGDDETIDIKLSQLPPEVDRLVCCINIYHAMSKNQNFGMVDNAFIRIADKATGYEICRFDLKRYGKFTGIIFGELLKTGDEWEFKAVGKGMNIRDLMETVNYI